MYPHARKNTPMWLLFIATNIFDHKHAGPNFLGERHVIARMHRCPTQKEYPVNFLSYKLVKPADFRQRFLRTILNRPTSHRSDSALVNYLFVVLRPSPGARPHVVTRSLGSAEELS